MQSSTKKASQGSRVRIRIKSIDIAFKISPKYPINLKLLLDDNELLNLKSIPAGQVTRWEDIVPIDAEKGGYLEIRVYEIHRWWLNQRKRVGSIQLSVHDIITATSTITTNFGYPENERAQEAQAKAKNIESLSVVDRMGRARDAVETIMKVGAGLAELHPTAKLVFGVCNQAWQTLKNQEQYDTLVVKLVDEMEDVLPYIAAIENHAKIIKLRDTVKELLLLVEDASWFVINYKSDGAAVRAVRAFVSSDAQGQVDDFVNHFGRLKENFDRGIAVQVMQVVEKILSDGDRALLDKLCAQGASYDQGRGCFEGTRTDTLEHIRDWASESNDLLKLFWLHGPAGCGKSAVATSFCDSLHQSGTLAGSFFCRRDSEQLRRPEKVISHLAASLAYKHSGYGTSLVEVLRKDPELARSPTRTRFTGILIGPLRSLEVENNPRTMTLVVDAIDECGTTESRGELMRCLLELSKLTSWLKILVTGRPIDEICRPLELERDPVARYDLFAVSRKDVTRDIFAYVRSRLSDIPVQIINRDRWPLESDLHRLAGNSNGLFIWAKTACDLIRPSLDPVATMGQILTGQKLKGAKKALAYIYTTALDEALSETEDDANIIQLCVGAIVLTGSRRPLPDTAIASMLPGRIKQHTLSRVVDRLGAVLYRDDDSAIRVLHQSFSDYMMENDCPEQYRIDVAAQNAGLAGACLRIMMTGLRFNMCNLEDSCLMNCEVPNLQLTIEQNIRPETLYSCVYWASHLVVTECNSVDQPIIALLDEFLCGRYLLYWIEALSLCQEVPAAMMSMSHIANWTSSHYSKYTKIAVEIYRFVSAAFIPISSSTPHLYVSALAYGAANYSTVKDLKKGFPNTLSVSSGMGLWSGQCIRVINAILSVTCIAISPDDRRIALCSTSVLSIMDAHTGQKLYEAPGDESLVSPEDNLLKPPEDDLQSVASEESSRPPLTGYMHFITSVAYSGDGQRIATGCNDHTVLICDARSGEPLLEPLLGHSGRVRSVSYSTDSQHIVSGSDDGTVRVWDAHAGTELLEPFRGHSGPVLSVSFSPNGQCIASGSDDNTLRIWDTFTGVALSKPLQGHEDSVTSVSFTADGRCVVSGSKDCTIRIWDAHTGLPLFQPLEGHANPVTSVACSLNGQHIVSGSEDRTVRTWNAVTGQPHLKPLHGHEATVSSVSFSADGQRIISGSHDGTVRIWDAHTDATVLEPLQGHSDRVRAVAFSSDGQRIASVSDDKSVRIWDARTGEPYLGPLHGHDRAVVSVAFSSDSGRLVSGSYDSTLRVWDAHTGANMVPPLRGHTDWVTSVAFSIDDQRIVSGSYDTTVRIWETVTGNHLLKIPQGHSSAISSVSFSPSGQFVISGSYDNSIQLWDSQTARPVLERLQGHDSAVTSVVFSADGKRVISGSYDKTVIIWDTHSGAMILGPLRGHSGIVSSVSLATDTGQIASVSHDMTVRIWDVQTGNTVIEPLRGHLDWVTSVAFSSDGQRIVSASDNRSIRIWNTHPIQPTFTLLQGLLKSARTPSQYVMSYQLKELLDEQGWVCVAGKRLFWIPLEYQRSRVDDCILSIGSNGEISQVTFDMSSMRIGTEWAT